ncbi:T9SS C-terminal target domain-containing protein [Mariniphaga sediminis]|uniref:T9SS C-terminal target domain-containing protein n=1 Tax=Mariniphaga sediminis TaxID=1628158 RepID=A0A399D1J0_9BACT|nr:T9SS type A sorting domain-containing protein [Mariniphaga sediminis]RIH65437.1 T9SS C-terminal target domain-containing protein [Mariniphaga sediminis]
MKQSYTKYSILVFCSLFISISSSAQKIFPGAVGFGTEFRGAYQGSETPTILTVDTLYAGILKTGTNRGSFQWAVSQTFPRIIVFEVGGVIDYSTTNTRYFHIDNPYINIYGQTAPSPGITLKSVCIYFRSHDLLMQHIAIRYGDYPRPDGTISPEDCFTGLDGSYNAVVDHCSFSWGADEVFGSYGKNFTLSNCLTYEALNYSYHANESGENEPEAHGFGAIVSSPTNVTIYNCLLGWYTSRFPLFRTDTIAYINNYATGYALLGADVRRAATGNNAAFIGNSFYPTPGMTSSKSEYFIYWRNGLDISSTIYMHDNNCIKSDEGQSQRYCIFTYMSETERNAIYTDNPEENVVDVSKYKIVPADDVIDSILINSGMRPWDRDYYDALALEKLKFGDQDYLNSPRAQPAKAYNLSPQDGLKTTAGNMGNGYDFSANNVVFTVNGTTISLTANTTSQSQVLDAINAQLPEGTIAIDHPNRMCKHIIIQTTTPGSDKEIVIGGDASVFGIASGTYKGQDAPYGDYEYPSARNSLDIPANAHSDDNLNGYTNIEEWVYSIANPGGIISSTTEIGNGNNNSLNNISIYPNPNNGKFFLNVSNLQNGEYIKKITITNVSGQTVYSSEFERSEQFTTKEFNLSEFSPGLYNLNVLSGTNIRVSKSIIIH